MKIISKENLQSIQGGISIWGIFGIGAIIAFISGVIDGIARPVKCN